MLKLSHLLSEWIEHDGSDGSCTETITAVVLNPLAHIACSYVHDRKDRPRDYITWFVDSIS